MLYRGEKEQQKLCDVAQSPSNELVTPPPKALLNWKPKTEVRKQSMGSPAIQGQLRAPQLETLWSLKPPISPLSAWLKQRKVRVRAHEGRVRRMYGNRALVGTQQEMGFPATSRQLWGPREITVTSRHTPMSGPSVDIRIMRHSPGPPSPSRKV